MSNFLGEVQVPKRPTSILSAAELMEREGMLLQKSMNFRDRGEQLSIFLVLAKDEGEFKDAWDGKKQIYTFEGHDSTTKETGGKSLDQLLMYGGDKLTENGRFYKAANEFKDGVRKDALQVQIYEKLDPGVWFDKGIFDLIDAAGVKEDGRKIFKFFLTPADKERKDKDAALEAERYLGAAAKAAAWEKGKGRCMKCNIESGLRFVSEGKKIKLLCAKDRGETSGWGLLG
ncbi:MAG: hypothetical protein WAZ27_01900 [Minisyncoccia bacterium]